MEKTDKTGFIQRLNKALDKESVPPKNKGRITYLADMMGLSHRGAGKWLDGETTPPTKKYTILAEKLHVDPEWLRTGRGNMVRDGFPITTGSSREVPLHTLNNLNNPYFTAAQNIVCYAASIGKTFALRVETEAMSPRFPMGSFIIIDTGKIARDGDFVIAQTLKFPEPQFRQFFVSSEKFRYLAADNPKFDRIPLSEHDKIIGVVIQAVLLFH